MDDLKKRIILDEIKQKQCLNCKIFCIFKSMNVDQMLEDWGKGRYAKLFQFIEKYKRCYV